MGLPSLRPYLAHGANKFFIVISNIKVSDLMYRFFHHILGKHPTVFQRSLFQ